MHFAGIAKAVAFGEELPVKPQNLLQGQSCYRELPISAACEYFCETGRQFFLFVCFYLFRLDG
jgi:hypothetical protein